MESLIIRGKSIGDNELVEIKKAIKRKLAKIGVRVKM